MIARLTGGLLFFAGMAAIGVAWWAEHVLGYAPCELCLIERAPWRIVAFLGVLALLIPGMVGFWATVLSLPALAAAVMLAGLHNGVEQKWWESPLPACHAPVFHTGASFRERMASMPLRPAKPCDDPTYLFHLPVSMTVLGGIAAALLFILVSYSVVLQARRWHAAR
ncbi:MULTISPECIES: disulfide bond formation protein B [Asaia]|uniref:Periplasmic thiol:disulfide oxidoreductase DsbB,required for DsbA reoxidation n=1 Tax=Asaia bogorensis TaxID=91915 RepID=A0A060QLF9_9PROT|nr:MULTISPECIES: disulfide bond formation protein B [Asaia]ETC98974.1 dihydrolipoamide acyltransferase [Asaia sp. SF2.1]MDL2171032.1 disulfide bond formation protein B [Asaia sp. HumB]CDG40706.1 Periplasmic thiol:disulfide oxidoreductase DsbB,required for DsbA reoxidation [Asaia bogorensis]